MGQLARCLAGAVLCMMHHHMSQGAVQTKFRYCGINQADGEVMDRFLIHARDTHISLAHQRR